jgi:hypothetical protein
MRRCFNNKNLGEYEMTLSRVMKIFGIIIVILIIGGLLLMIKRVLKEETVDLKDISRITINNSRADVFIYTSNNDKLKITQYSRSKIEEEKKFNISVSNGDLLISNDYDSVMAGISYEIYIPISYKGSLDICTGKGNIEYKGENSLVFNSFNTKISERGDIIISNLGISSNSDLYTKIGNIDLSISNNDNCKVIGKSDSGDVNVDPKYNNGNVEVNVETSRGNIKVS